VGEVVADGDDFLGEELGPVGRRQRQELGIAQQVVDAVLDAALFFFLQVLLHLEATLREAGYLGRGLLFLLNRDLVDGSEWPRILDFLSH
jgi:hypothetical protein